MSDELPLILGDGGDAIATTVADSLSVTDDDICDAVGLFVADVFGANFPFQRGQLNRVPESLGPDHMIITPMFRGQLSTNLHTNDPDAEAIVIVRPTAAHLQIDVYGPRSTDNAQVFTTLWRDAYACELLAETAIQPLYCDDGRQMPLIDGEKQYEDRWTINAVVQINPAVSTPVPFADSVTVTLIEAD